LLIGSADKTDTTRRVVAASLLMDSQVLHDRRMGSEDDLMGVRGESCKLSDSDMSYCTEEFEPVFKPRNPFQILPETLAAISFNSIWKLSYSGSRTCAFGS